MVLALRQLERFLASITNDVNRCEKVCRSVTNWDALVAEAEHHGVLGILQHEMAAMKFAPPGAVMLELGRRARLQQMLQRRLREALDDVLSALHAAGLDPVALKGPLLGERLYGNSALRLSSDLDLLISVDEIEAATTALNRLGYLLPGGPSVGYYRRYHHHLAFMRPDGLTVELHFCLYTGFGAVLASEEFLARARSYDRQCGIGCRVLCPEDELMFLLIHAAGHQFARLAWLYDIKAFLRTVPIINWAVLKERARHHGVINAVRIAGAILQRRLGIRLPDLLYPSGWNRYRQDISNGLLSASAALEAYPVPARVLDLWFQATLSDRFISALWFLGHHFLRIARRRAQLSFPRLVPAKWAG